MASLAKWQCLLIVCDLRLQKIYFITGLSVLLQHIAVFLRILVWCARQNYFMTEYSIPSSEILTSYWQLVSKITRLQWIEVRI